MFYLPGGGADGATRIKYWTLMRNFTYAALVN
jgi:hypothetical protein